MNAEKIRQLRWKLGMTQEIFSQLLKVSLRSLSRWESGKTQPSLMALQKLEELEKKK